jgi:hypothetical protein
MGGPWLKYFKCETMGELTMFAKKHAEVAGAVRQIRRMSPIRMIREMIFEYEDAKRIRMGQDRYQRIQGYKEAEAKYQEQLAASVEQLQQRDEEVRRLREELARKG